MPLLQILEGFDSKLQSCGHLRHRFYPTTPSAPHPRPRRLPALYISHESTPWPHFYTMGFLPYVASLSGPLS